MRRIGLIQARLPPRTRHLSRRLVLLLAEDAPPNVTTPAYFKVLIPSGKIGNVKHAAVQPSGGDQLCYVREPAGWKIVGFLGGDQHP
jgi:hypothetical protein